jgi:hypothetical protein
MPAQPFKALIKSSGIGLGLGVLMNVLAFFLPGFLMLIYQGINAPALGIAYLWTYCFKLPPQSEMAWVLVPAVTIFLQWTLLGFLVGLWRYFRLRE